jgi:hypothetical protein
MGLPGQTQSLSPAARVAKLIERSLYCMITQKLASHANMFRQLWTCENCGDSGMTIFVQHCPQCQQYRPEKADTYHGKEIRKPCSPPTYQYGVLENKNVPNTLPSRSSPKTPLPSSRLASDCPLPQTIAPFLVNLTRSATPKRDDQGLESPAATGGTTVLSS